MHRCSTSLALLTIAVAPMLGAQSASSIAARVAGAPDGEVRMSYASRPDACGDGKGMINLGGHQRVTVSADSRDSWAGFNCIHGPARVALTVRNHQVIGVRTRVGGSWPAGGAALDIGTVPAREAAAYFISLAPRLSDSGHNPLFAAVLADSADIAPDLLRLARDGSRSAVGALAMLDDDAGLTGLMELARKGSESVRKSAVFWLGQSDEPRALALVRTVIDDEHETIAVRKSAIFAFGQGKAPVPDLVSMYRRLQEPKLREQAIFALAQRDEDAAADALMNIARSDESRPMRGKALFWLAQKDDPRVAKLIAEIVSR